MSNSGEVTANPPAEKRSKTRTVVSLILMLLIAGGLAFVIHAGLADRALAESKLVGATEQAAVPVVNVVNPVIGSPMEEIVLPGNTQAFTTTPIYARTSGYLKKWYFDIGAQVKQGQLLAEIETPEVDRQVQQARADLETARANYHLAETTATRWEALLKTNSVSKQETDQAVSNLGATKATVESNEANVHRLEELQSFEKVYAPFDGVITARNTDTGALIGAGANTPSQELFHLAAIDTLRVFVAIPEVYSRAAVNGSTAALTLDEYPGQTFRGTIVRNTSAIDQTSRTLTVEVDVKNPAGKLLPGAYVTVHFKLPGTTRAATIPANTLLFRAEGLRVGVVRDNQVTLIPVKIGRDYGSTVEVISGLQLTDAVIVDPSDSLMSGERVRPNGKPAEPNSAPAATGATAK